MFSDLKDKIDMEYDTYKSLTLAQSRESIFAKAEEIYCKKKIRDVLLELNKTGGVSEDQKNKMMRFMNLIDTIYLAIAEDNVPPDNIPSIVENFLKFKINYVIE